MSHLFPEGKFWATLHLKGSAGAMGCSCSRYIGDLEWWRKDHPVCPLKPWDLLKTVQEAEMAKESRKACGKQDPEAPVRPPATPADRWPDLGAREKDPPWLSKTRALHLNSKGHRTALTAGPQEPNQMFPYTAHPQRVQKEDSSTRGVWFLRCCQHRVRPCSLARQLQPAFPKCIRS